MGYISSFTGFNSGSLRALPNRNYLPIKYPERNWSAASVREYNRVFRIINLERKPFFYRSDEGLALETSAFKLLTVANLRYQLS